MPSVPPRTKLLVHIFRMIRAGGGIAMEGAKAVPKTARWGLTTKSGAATIGFGAGSYVGYKTSRRLQRVATGYALPGRQ